MDEFNMLSDYSSASIASSNPTTVLVGFADALSAPEAVWSLAEAGFRVTAFARKNSRPALRKSKFVTLFFISDPAESLSDALSDLSLVVDQLNPVVMPLDDAALCLLQKLRAIRPMLLACAVGRTADYAL